MQKIKGPGIFLAQFLSDQKPFSTLPDIVNWAAELGYKGVQIPTWDSRCFDLQTAASSQSYCDDINALCEQAGVQVTELSTHMQGQLVASHSAFDDLFNGFAPAHIKPSQRQAWATEQLMFAAKASQRLGLKAHATFSGALLWPMFYPWPQRPKGLVEQGFAELAARWLPILDTFAEHDVALCYELHPGEDLHDGITFERFLDAVDHHRAAKILYDPSHFVLQQLDYLAFIDHYHQHIGAFHVKDAEFNPNGRSGVYGGYADWIDRPGRFRSIGDGQIDFQSIFSKLTQYNYQGWAVLEWECCIKHPEQGAREGAQRINDYLINVTEHAFDDFAGTTSDSHSNRKILGLNP